eukprot:403351747
MKNIILLKIWFISLSFLQIIKFSQQTIQSNKKLAFVFELLRHGARAPLIQEPEGYFLVGPGMLTQSGMRQRYIQGRLNRQKYIDFQNGEFIDSDWFNPEQIQIFSTNVHRAIQSSYAELLGLYGPKLFNKKSEDDKTTTTERNDFSNFMNQNEKKSLMEGKGMPQLKFSKNQKSIHDYDELDNVDFSLIPLFNFMKAKINDDITETGCPYAGSQYSSAYFNPEYYQNNTKQLLEILRAPYIEAFNLHGFKARFMNFTDMYDYSDVLLGEEFEGTCKTRYNFTNEEWYYNRYVQMLTLTLDFLDYSRQLYITKMLRKPLKHIQSRIDDILGLNKYADQDNLRILIYSGHDVQISNLLHQLQPREYNQIVDIPYSSLVTFELFYDSSCVEQFKNGKINGQMGSKGHDCFEVKIYFNGNPLTFDQCQGDDEILIIYGIRIKRIFVKQRR